MMPVRSSLFPPNAWRTTARISAALITLAVFTACSPDQPSPTGLKPSLDASRSVGPPAEALASPLWQATARNLVSQALFSPVAGGHAYPILSVAQYLAVQRAERVIGGDDDRGKRSSHDGGDREHQSGAIDRGAVAGASVVALTYLFPTKAQSLEDMVTAQASAGNAKSQAAFAAGEAIGRGVGAEIVTRAIGDGFNTPRDPAPPIGPGYWTGTRPVAGATLPTTTPWFLKSADQFRPGPPPAFGSPAFNAALAEIRHISDTRTAEQVRIASFWPFNNGTPTAAGFWLSVPTDSGWVTRHGLSELETTHLFALMSATMFDAMIGCWDTKLTYWLIRPWVADPAITVVAAVGKPNHPSYPSGHSCVSSSGAEVLKAFFPEKGKQLDAMVTEAGLSRMYGGIHYRFDIDAGQVLGRSVARFTIRKDASGRSVLSLPHRHGDDEHKGGDGHH